MYVNSIELEWDTAKRDWTLQMRGLDFADVASADWDTALTLEDARQDYAEARYVTLAPIHSRLCVFAWCWRGDRMRVISLRKANARERKRYEQS